MGKYRSYLCSSVQMFDKLLFFTWTYSILIVNGFITNIWTPKNYPYTNDEARQEYL